MTEIRYQILTAADPTVTRIIPELAVEIGLNESVVLLQLAFWINNCENIRDGEFWTYQSLRDMKKKAFPYWDVSTITRTIKKLETDEFIKVGNYNKRSGDNTRWFALNPIGLKKLKSIVIQEVGVLQNATGVLQNATTLPEITTDTKDKDLRGKPASSRKGEFTKSKFYPVDHTHKIIYTRAYTEKEYAALIEAWKAKGITPVRGDWLNTDTQYESFTRQKPPAKRNPLFDAFAECAFGMKPGFDPELLNGNGGRVGKLVFVLAEHEGITFNDANDNKTLAMKVRECYTAWKNGKKIDPPRDPVAFIAWWSEWQNENSELSDQLPPSVTTLRWAQ